MSFLRRIEPFLYSRKNIAGSLLALGGLALYFLGITGGLVWLPVTAALYAIGYLVVPRERGVSLTFSADQDAKQVAEGLQRLLYSIRGRVADDIFMRVESIRDSILLTLPQIGDAVDATDPNVYLIRQTALNYLPQALDSYLAVPRLYAEMRPVAGGKTPHDVLVEQLELMARKLREVAEDIATHDSDRLLANGRFLSERFATSSLKVAAPVAEREKARIL
jgi:hypothetical protein